MHGNIRIYAVNGLRGDILDKEDIDLLVEAGTVWITVSIETPSRRLQKKIKKFLNIEKIKKNIQYMGTKDIVLNYCFVIGLPEETEEEAHSILDFIKELPPFLIPMLFAFKGYPGSEYYDEIQTPIIQTETPVTPAFEAISEMSCIYFIVYIMRKRKQNK